MPEKDVISCSTVICGLAAHGRAHEAVRLFAEMDRERRVKPNGVTFVGLLSACSHAGLLTKACAISTEWARDAYSVEHCGCIVDLLGRSGRIQRALHTIRGMPVPADAKIWGSLLSACRSHGDVDTAVVAAERLVDLEPGRRGQPRHAGQRVRRGGAVGRCGEHKERDEGPEHEEDAGVQHDRGGQRGAQVRPKEGDEGPEHEEDAGVQHDRGGQRGARVHRWGDSENLGPEMGGLAALLDILASQLADHEWSYRIV
ncbi:pentatricopeptide repeat-containing protein At2g20540-like [Phragmites australis]|uniref:pentatricopeptide repeat-containing protein At2g20540-like n=1 Tax=Phragmites australis TaxID=29695 RepID=UPI002D766F06|nr:pentatricopeptide repeat-containing protein At2g20540-like [Phragmites australis]